MIRHLRKQICLKPWTLWLYGKCNTIAGSSSVVFKRQNIRMKCRIYKEEPHGGFLPPKIRHEHVTDFAAHAMNMNLHKTVHRGTQQADDILERKHFFLFFLALEVVYTAQPMRRSVFLRHSTGVRPYYLYYYFLLIFFLTHARWPYTCLIGQCCMYHVQR